jgi:predicted phosphodiesterase
MSKTRYIGDVHGHVHELQLVLNNLPEDVTSVVQVGDMGVGFGKGEYWHTSLDEMMVHNNAKFIRGNHDSPDECKKMESWIPDSTVINDVMYVGGAWSIDHHWRTMGINIWEDEELSYTDLNIAIDTFKFARPRVMVTHDCPEEISLELFIKTGNSIGGGIQFKTRTASALQTMFKHHQPDLHIFGHWHTDVDEVVNGTRFICLGELSYCDVDDDTLEIVWQKTIRSF